MNARLIAAGPMVTVPGKVADVLVVNGDPLQDTRAPARSAGVRAITQVRLVITTEQSYEIKEVKYVQASGLPAVCDVAGHGLWKPTGCHADASALDQHITCANAYLVASYSDCHTCAADHHIRATDGNTPAHGYADAAPRWARRWCGGFLFRA